MNEYFAALADAWTIISESPLFPLFLGVIGLYLCHITLLMIFSAVMKPCSLLDVFDVFFIWFSDKIVTWMCSSEKGFFLAYKLGWARPGVDFFDCGIDCPICPKKDTCPSAVPDQDASSDW